MINITVLLKPSKFVYKARGSLVTAIHIIGPFDKIAFWGSEWSLKTAQNTNNKFWKDVLLSWSKTILILTNLASCQSKMCVPLLCNQ